MRYLQLLAVPLLFLGFINPASTLQDQVIFESEPLEVSTQYVTYFSSEGAQILEKDGKTLVLAEKLDLSPKYGALLEVKDQPNDFIEIYELTVIDGKTFASYPPKVETPLSEGVPNTYLVTGDKCSRIGVAIRSSEAPVWLELNLEGCDELDQPDEPDQPEPTPDLVPKVIALTDKTLKELSDPITQKSILDELNKVSRSSSDTVETYYKKIQEAISTGLIEAKVNPPYKDWYGTWRKPLHDLIKANPTSVGILEKTLEAIKSSFSSQESKGIGPLKGTITMYTNKGCIICEKWKAEVLPYFDGTDWTVIEKTDTINPVPWFEVETNGKKFSTSGYLPLSTFNRAVEELKK